MAREALLAIVLLSAGFAGCLGSEPSEPATTAQNREQANVSQRNGTAAAPTNATDPARAGPVESPSWEEGRWWRYEVDHALAETRTITLVVAEATAQAYRLGWTEVEPALATLLFHFPPAGELTRPNLGWWMHDETVAILDFPLEDGKTWSAHVGDQDLRFTAERNGTRDGAPVYTIEGVDGNGTLHVEARYSAAVGFFTQMARYFDRGGPPSPGVQLVDHGNASTLPGDGTVVVPSMTDALDHAVLGPDLEQGRPPTGQPAGTFQVDEGTSYLAFGAFLGGAEGVYEVGWRAPGGGPTVVQEENAPGEEAVYLATSFPSDPAGRWEYQAAPLGPGFVFLEAVAVTTETVTVAG